MAQLVIERGPQQGARLQLAAGRYSAGSDPANDIVLLDPALAPTHFLIEVTDNAVAIEADQGPVAFANSRRVLQPGAAPSVFRSSVRFAAGQTGFAVSLPAPAVSRPRRHLRTLAVPLLALGILSFADGVAPASIASPAAAVTALRAVPRPAGPDIIGAFRAQLDAAHLDALALARADDGSFVLTGTVLPAQEPVLRGVTRWFDTSFGAQTMLLDHVRIVSEPPPLAVRAAWTGSGPYVIDGAGQRLLLGARLANGWTITSIAADAVTLQRAGRTLSVRF